MVKNCNAALRERGIGQEGGREEGRETETDLERREWADLSSSP